MKIAVIDGQGGGIGKLVVEKLRRIPVQNMQIIALGTNVAATTLMLRAGASEGATGENAIVYNVPGVDIIIGAIGIVVANSMMGELTPLMAEAISSCHAKKILIPLQKCNIEIAGVKNIPLPQHIENAISMVEDYMLK
ncbi:MAG: DUF3842 family protein [Clostridium sp.]|nr:DUF3842 family protein [Clostridium sp.]